MSGIIRRVDCRRTSTFYPSEDTKINSMQMFLCQDRGQTVPSHHNINFNRSALPAYFSCSGMVRILKQIPEVSLCGGAGAAPEVFLLFSLLLGFGEEPPGPVVSMLAAGLHVEII